MIRAYHFVRGRLRDGRPVPPDGEWLVHDGPVIMCKSGLHASRHPFDALIYAPGNVLCLVDCDDVVDAEGDKLVCRRRRIVARFDAESMLRQFARQCALDVIHLWDAPDIVRQYLATGDESLRAAARAAAWDAAWDAAESAAEAAEWAAARDAAEAAARAAARDAAWAAARDAAEAAAEAAEWAAARDAARDVQKEKFAALVKDQFAAMGITP